MIVKDEQDFIEECLQSVRELVDEIIIIDTGSKDNTKLISSQFTTKIFDFQWNNSFAEARNESLKRATGDWILVLDADERIAPNDFKILRNAMDADSAVMGFSIVQRNYTNDTQREDLIGKPDAYKESQEFYGWSESLICRLFRNKNIRFVGEVHELIEPSIRKAGGKIELLPIPIHHLKEKCTPEREKKKLEQYKTLCAAKIKNEPSNARAYHEMGTILRVLGEHKQALIQFEKAFSLNPRFAEAAYGAGVMQNAIKQPIEALKSFSKALEIMPNYQDALISMSISYAQMHELDNAISSSRAAVELGPSIKAQINLAAYYEKSGELEKAELLLIKVLADYPNEARAHHNLGVVYEKQDKLKEAIEQYSIAAAQQPRNKKWQEDLQNAKINL